MLNRSLVLLISVLLFALGAPCATTFLVPQNNASSTLASGISASSPTMTLATGGGARFPSTYPYRVLIDTTEIVQVTNRTGDVLSVTRAQEGTAAVSHSTADTVRLTVTAGYITQIQTAVNALENIDTESELEAQMADGSVFLTNNSTSWTAPASCSILDTSDNVIGVIETVAGLLNIQCGKVYTTTIGPYTKSNLITLASGTADMVGALTVRNGLTSERSTGTGYTDSENAFTAQRLTGTIGNRTGTAFYMRNEDVALKEYGFIGSSISWPVAGAENGDLVFDTIRTGTLTRQLTVYSTGKLAARGPVLCTTITTFTANDTSPSVSTGNVFKIPGTWTAGNNVTTLDNGHAGQWITVIGGDSDCIFVDAGTLDLNGNWTAASGKVLMLVYDGTAWRETPNR